MTQVLATVSPEAVGTAFAAVIASLTGWAAYRTNARQKATELALEKTDKTAELAKSEVEGWKVLIETLTAQYNQSTLETLELRKRLVDGNTRFEEISIELHEAKDQTAEGLLIIKRLEGEVRDLRNKITNLLERLADGAERSIKRVEQNLEDLHKQKKGERGESGKQGEQGESGRKGDTGESGKQGEQGESGERGYMGKTGEGGEGGEGGAGGEGGNISKPGKPGKRGSKGEPG